MLAELDFSKIYLNERLPPVMLCTLLNHDPYLPKLLHTRHVCIFIACLKDFGDSADVDQLLEALDTHDPDQAFAKLRKVVPDQVYCFKLICVIM